MGIQISIKAGADASTSSVSASGSVQHIITDNERKTFGIEMPASRVQLKNILEKNLMMLIFTALLHGTTFTKHTDGLKFKQYSTSRVQQ